MKPTPTQKKKLYALLHELVRLRDGAACLKCSKTEGLQLSHIYPKGRYRGMEFVDLNTKLLCTSCHIFWWHRNPIEAVEWINQKLPKERMDKLKLMSNTYMGGFDPKLVIIELTEKIKKLKRIDQSDFCKGTENLYNLEIGKNKLRMHRLPSPYLSFSYQDN